MRYKCLIVDDEPLAIEAVAMHLKEFEDFEIVGKCRNAMEAVKLLNEKAIDLIFLDINMPKISGISFLKSLSSPPSVIITTAYSEYALEGFELDVLDYLLKPIPFDRFLKSINKFLEQKDSTSFVINKDDSTIEDNAHIFIRCDRKLTKIYLDDILYFESEGDYVKVVTSKKSLLTKNKISLFEEKLPADRFTRVHRSFIVNNQSITSVTSSGVEIEKKEIPVSQTYKNQLMKALNLSGNMI